MCEGVAAGVGGQHLARALCRGIMAVYCVCTEWRERLRDLQETKLMFGIEVMTTLQLRRVCPAAANQHTRQYHGYRLSLQALLGGATFLSLGPPDPYVRTDRALLLPGLPVVPGLE
jgi:hypothetical protein